MGLLSLALIYSGWLWVGASNEFNAGRIAHRAGNSAIGIQYVNRALNAYRLDMRHRFQLALSMNDLLSNGDFEIHIDHAAIDRVHEVGMSSSRYHPAMLIVRAEWLMKTNQWTEELNEIIEWMRENATMQSEAQEVVRYYEENS